MTPMTPTGIAALFGAQERDISRIESEVADIARQRRTAGGLLDGMMKGQSTGYELTELGARTILARSLSSSVQSAYTGIERVMKVTLEALDDFVPSGDSWHRGLLDQAASEGPARPPLLAHETFMALGTLRNFKHFIRNAYGIELDTKRIDDLADTCVAAFSMFKVDLATLEASLIAEASPEPSDKKAEDSPSSAGLAAKRRSP